MSRIASFIIIVAVLALGGGFALGFNQQWYDLPKEPPPYEYGNVVISRATANTDVPSVTFSHWQHRLHYTCRVCHLELEFWMKANMTEITEEKNREGRFCGACHNGKIAFGHEKKHCKKCHTRDTSRLKRNFKKLRRLPRDDHGNWIDWARAYDRRAIKPKLSLFDEYYEPMDFEKEFSIRSKWSMVPPADFSHETHLDWLDCANCHPDVFNIKKNTTSNFYMDAILEGRFCGACHLNVAFPIHDCQRCHPGIK